MTEAEIEALIFTHEHAAALGKDRGPSHAKAVEFHSKTASALRFLLKEREDLIQATAAKDLAHCDQLHAAEWQTIETAPDDTKVLIWEPVYGINTDANGDFGWEGEPTHWMPLPSPPQRQGDRPETGDLL